MTYLCVPIFVTDPDKGRRDMATAIEAGADIVELRMDALEDAELATNPSAPWYIRGDFRIPTIVTCRPIWEGGHSTLSDEQRLKFLRMVRAGDVGYVDIELESARNIDVEPDLRNQVILS